MSKSALRQQLIAQRRAMPAPIRHVYSQAIMQHVLSFLQTRQAKYVLAYRSMGSEVETTFLHTEKEQSFSVYAPVCDHGMSMTWYDSHDCTWKTTAQAILEPQGGAVWRIGMVDTWVLCPLLGFDRSGHRLGMGKGYFDRWLASNRHAIVGSIGLAFSGQELHHVPHEVHDQRLNFIMTEKGMLCLNP
ncbi:MAG: 5-formyltetrahydrofolate cyclo-ligase [Mariprofundaceae bacterium]|nr:5-formyltetrahydrofolate cyclo-ligase [Mariprofundaceae bacterium]